MDQTKFQMARALQLRIDTFQNLLSSLAETNIVTLNLGRGHAMDIPAVLNKPVIKAIKAAVTRELTTTRKEFEDL